MEVNGQLDALAPVPLKKELIVSIGQKAGLVAKKKSSFVRT
jgi:hypothetical protein